MVFESQLNPGRLALVSTKEETSEQAYISALEMTKKTYGDLLWMPKLATTIDIDTSSGTTSTITKEVDFDKNWAMKTIIDRKDLLLFNAMTPYLSEPERKLLEEKLQ